MSSGSDANPGPRPKIIVDEDWKARVESERESERARRESGGHAAEDRPPAARRLPPATFLTLCQSLAAQASAALAESARLAHARSRSNIETSGISGDATSPQPGDESGGDPRLHLEIARHVIDTLAILEEKTAGNRTEAESMFLGSVLHELRLAFVAFAGPGVEASSP